MILTFLHYAHPFDRENINEPKDKVLVMLLTITSVTVGFLLGMEWQEQIILKELAKRRRA
jgi:hypothetical protein